jgi:glucose-6-phosphate 1-dehydrogenase
MPLGSFEAAAQSDARVLFGVTGDLAHKMAFPVIQITLAEDFGVEGRGVFSFIDSRRWQGVPWYLRSGKYLPVTARSEIEATGATP